MKTQKKYFKAIFMMILFVTLFYITNVKAATYYVDQGNSAANDSNTGAESSPWKTISKALQTVVAGDTVIVKSGRYTDPSATYESAFNPVHSGMAGSPITIQSSPQNAAVLYSNAINKAAIAIFSRDYIIIDGFKTEGLISVKTSENIIVKNCEVTLGGIFGSSDPSLNAGIFIFGAYNKVQNNYVHDMRNSGNNTHNTSGIMVLGSSTSSSYNTIENNTVDCSSGVVYSAYGQKGGNIDHNTWRYNIAKNCPNGFLGMGSTDSTLYSDYNSLRLCLSKRIF